MNTGTQNSGTLTNNYSFEAPNPARSVAMLRAAFAEDGEARPVDLPPVAHLLFAQHAPEDFTTPMGQYARFKIRQYGSHEHVALLQHKRFPDGSGYRPGHSLTVQASIPL